MWNGKRDKVEKQTRDGNGTAGRNGRARNKTDKTRRIKNPGRVFLPGNTHKLYY